MRRLRTAFTIIETLTALTMLGTLLVLMAQIVAWSTQERGQQAARQTAIETANNVLESARATPFAQLDAGWAATQKLNLEESALPFDSRLEVRVEPAFAGLKRVTVTVGWNTASAVHAREVRLFAVFGPGTPKEKGKP